ncbi:MAG: hypothetical protein WC159_07455 [Sphaerochaetaceae bacterium]
MRNLKQKILIVSVFFVVLSLTGCGIPSILYLISTSDYNFTAISPYNESSYVGISSLSISSIDEYLEYCYGPSVMFFYSIGGSTEHLVATSKFVTQFATQYINQPYGVAISTSDNNIMSVTDSDGYTQNLYGFNKLNESGQYFKAPYYNLYATTYSESLNDLKLTIADDKSHLTISNFGDKYTCEVPNLYRYNGNAFKTSDYSTIDDDYAFVKNTAGDNSQDICIYIFAAFSIMKTTESSFGNNFWSPLLYLGYIKIK